jgi:hypothetical protein
MRDMRFVYLRYDGEKENELVSNIILKKMMKGGRKSEIPLTHYCIKILIQESFRVLNEHAMRLLITHKSNFVRESEELSDKERNLFEGILPKGMEN